MQAQRLHLSTGHRAAIYALAPGINEGTVLSAGGDGWIAEWSVETSDNGQLVATVETQVFALLHLPAQQWIVAGNMQGGLHWIDRYQATRSRNIQHHQKGVFGLVALGNSVFSIGGDGVLTRWEAREGRAVESLQLSNQALRSIAIAPDGQHITIGSSDNNIYILNAETFALQKTLTNAHQNSVFSLAYTPDGRHLLSGGRDALLNIWAAQDDFNLVSSQPAHWYTINDITFSPDGLYFATASRDKTVKIWDATTFQLLKVLDIVRSNGHRNSVNRLLWLPQVLVSCSDDRTLLWWQIEH
jgi:WD40 repeat protein